MEENEDYQRVEKGKNQCVQSVVQDAPESGTAAGGKHGGERVSPGELYKLFCIAYSGWGTARKGCGQSLQILKSKTKKSIRYGL